MIIDLFVEHRKDIREDLFFEPEGIHGVSHAERVLFLALNIAKNEDYSRSDMELLMAASKYHDIGRTHNGVCLVHGLYSNRKIDKMNLLEEFSEENRTLIKYIIHSHCIDDRDKFKTLDKYKIRDQERAIRLLKAFKDSDGLDRVRIRDLDTNYLRIDSSKKLVPLAEKIFKEGILIDKN